MGFLQDARYGVRMLLKSPVFSIIAILTLALGMGANTAMFSIVYGVLLRPLPVEQSDRVLHVYTHSPQFDRSSVSYPNFLDWQRRNQSFSQMAAFRNEDLNFAGVGEATRVRALMVSQQFFPLLGVQPIVGRNFNPEEDALGANPVMLVSEAFWKTQLGGKASVLGRSVSLNDVAYTIIGVVPTDLGVATRRQVFISLAAWRQPALMDRGTSFGLQAIARLRPGVTEAQAKSDMDNIARALAQEYPEQDKDRGITLVPLREDLVGDVRMPLFVLLGAVGFVLLIACANVANLMLARSVARRREFAVRTALGASAGRIVRQMLTEGMLLAFAGGALGLAIAVWINSLFLAKSFDIPRASSIKLDNHVLLFTAAIALLTSVIFGLGPAIQSARSDISSVLKEASRGSSGRHGLQRTLVIGEVALALVLTAAAGLMVKTVWRLWQVDPGFDPHDVITFAIFGSPAPSSNPPAQRTAYEAIDARFHSIPGVQYSSGMIGALPLEGDWDVPFWVVGKPKPENQTLMPWTLFYYVEPQYRDVMGIPLVRGRFLTDSDVASSPTVAVVDEELTKRYLPGEDPIGKHLHLELIGADVEVVGVVKHVVQWGLDSEQKQTIRAQVYMALRQVPDGVIAAAGASPTRMYAMRTATPIGQVAAAVKRQVSEANPRLALSDMESMSDVMGDSLQQQRFVRLLLGAFALLAMVLAGIGIYGVISYTVSQSTREIGIRMALGASTSQVLGAVLRNAMVAVLGIAIGAVAALGATRLMRGLLFNVGASDPLTFTAVAVLLAGVALLASYLPARRAASVDPLSALRYE